MIVRVEVAASSAVVPLASVATRDGSVRMLVPVSEPLRARMNGRAVAFFRMAVEGGVVEIGDEAEEVEW